LGQYLQKENLSGFALIWKYKKHISLLIF
jgi:hypothetical protein